ACPHGWRGGRTVHSGGGRPRPPSAATAASSAALDAARKNRPSLYHLCRARPRPLAPPELRFEVRERVGAAGVVEPLDETSLDELVGQIRDAGAESVAVCLLFSYLEPAHDAAVAAALRERLPDVPVSA